ncbi:hypothetical protein WA026_005972 [Henosepilachna vigintioctopunctata]|uniref:Major facilitator superfamily (MFS) profile domain-containing protein n=1 Tax=Henosepilachna vigintioctopunctata TaxID=420089 RepID=A0AAW1U3R6_9CUCU
MIFDDAGGNWSGEVDNIIVGIIQLIVSIFAATIMDKFRRKRLLSVSAAACGGFMGILSIYFILKDQDVDLHGFGWLPLVSFVGFVSSFNLGLGPLANTVLGELFPQSVKTVAMSLCCLWNNILAFSMTFIFRRVQQWIGLGETLLIFCIMALLGTVFIQIFIVETKGKTLEEIQDELNNVKKENL